MEKFEQRSSTDVVFISMGLCLNETDEQSQKRVINRLGKLTIPRIIATFSNATLEDISQDDEAIDLEPELKIREDANTTNDLNKLMRNLLISISDKIEISDESLTNFIKNNNNIQNFPSDPILILEKFMKNYSNM